MEEKNLTDEEIVKALTCKKEVILEEVHRTNNSVDDLIVCVDAKVVVGALDFIHRLQGDYSILKERYVKVLGLNEKVIAEQKAKIERLTEEKWQAQDDLDNYHEMLQEAEKENTELQKQVDELTAFKNEAISMSLYGKGRKDGEEVAVKDTAKEIYGWLKEHFDGAGWDIVKAYFREKGVEVE